MHPKSNEAHFVELFPRDVLVLLGAHNLSNSYETRRQSLSPLEIHVHEEWNPNVYRYDADLAMLILEDKVHFTQYIRPICFWSFLENPQAQEGSVTGWGQGEDKSNFYETIPKHIKVPTHLNEDCFLAHPEFARISSKRTFCGGSGNGTGVCLGDSGNGLYIEDEGTFFLLGIVSSSFISQGSCDLTKYAVYTNLLKFKSWILKFNEERKSCTQPKDSGHCKKFVVKYAFDLSLNTCQQFEYGGCGGNNNRFDTQPECEQFCVVQEIEGKVLNISSYKPLLANIKSNCHSFGSDNNSCSNRGL